MSRSHFVAVMLTVGLTVPVAGIVFGQSYPSKPIRIVASEPGGSTDYTARLIAQGISGPLGQPVIVDNRGGIPIAAETVAKAPPDGYSVLFASGALWIGPLIQKRPWDTFRDFSPIILTDQQPNILVVHPSLPVKSVKELIALAKARPGELNYSSGPTGSPPHLDVELLKSMAGVNVVRVPYKGGGPALNALIGGEVQLMISPTGSVSRHLTSGRVRALAVTSAQPSALLPGLPTVAASLPGYESGSTHGILAPAGTPETIVNRLNQEIVRVLNGADAKEKFLNAGVEVVGSSPEQFAATMKSDIVKWGKVIKDAGIKLE